jgi:predicted regulator of Ras-like GTPase activity (Roadblock/LC7/MglB family)
MRSSAAYVILIVLSAMLIYGCVQEETFFPEKGKLETPIVEDLDFDGHVDVWTYAFEPQDIGNLSIKRVVVVRALRELGRPWEEPVVFSEEKKEEVPVYSYNFSAANISAIKGSLAAFSSEKMQTEAECKRMLGLDRPDLPCYDRDSCLKSCYTPICRPMALGVGKPFLDSLLDLSTRTKDVDQQLVVLDGIVRRVEAQREDVPKELVEELLGGVTKLIDLSVVVNQNDVFNPSVYYLCKPIEYNIMGMRGVVKIVEGSRQLRVPEEAVSVVPPTLEPVIPEEFIYSSYLFVNSTEEAYTEITIADAIPDELEVNPVAVTLTENSSSISQNPVVVTWKGISIGGGAATLLAYDFKINKSITADWIGKNVKTPNITLRRVSITESPVFVGAMDFVNGIFFVINDALGYYIAFGIVGVVLFVFFGRIVWTTLRLAFRMANAIEKKKGIMETVYEFAGRASEDVMVYIGIAILLVIAGIVLINPSAPTVIKDEKIIIGNVLYNIAVEPTKTFGTVLFFLGLLSVYFVAEDLAKGLVLGKKYYKSATALLVDYNERRFKELEDAIGRLKEKIEAGKRARIDVSEEQEVLFTIPSLDRMGKKMKDKKTLKEAKGMLDETVGKVELGIAKVEEKMKLMEESWEGWSRMIEGLLSTKKTASAEMLIDIPKTWREWALEKYLSERKGEGLIMEKGVLKAFAEEKVGREGLTEVLRDLVSSGRIDGGTIIGKDGAIVAAELPEKSNKAVVAVMCSKMIAGSEELTAQLEKGKMEYAIATMKDGKLLARRAGNGILLCLVGKDVDILLALRATERVAKMIKEAL